MKALAFAFLRILGWIIISLTVFSGLNVAGQPGKEKGTTGFWEEFHRSSEPYQGPPRSGKQVYEYRCKTCHGRATQGAPMPGDTYEWEMRARQGEAVLLEHVKNGFRQGLMPPRGGCNCSDDELRAAIAYMLKKSGINIKAVKSRR